MDTKSPPSVLQINLSPELQEVWNENKEAIDKIFDNFGKFTSLEAQELLLIALLSGWTRGWLNTNVQEIATTSELVAIGECLIDNLVQSTKVTLSKSYEQQVDNTSGVVH